MPTTQAEREESRALVRENLRKFVDEINSTRGDVPKENLHCALSGLQIAATLNLAETIEAATDRSDEAEKIGKSEDHPYFGSNAKT